MVQPISSIDYRWFNLFLALISNGSIYFWHSLMVQPLFGIDYQWFGLFLHWLSMVQPIFGIEYQWSIPILGIDYQWFVLCLVLIINFQLIFGIDHQWFNLWKSMASSVALIQDEGMSASEIKIIDLLGLLFRRQKILV